VHSWTAAVPASEIESTLSSIGTLEQVDVTQRNGSADGRARRGD